MAALASEQSLFLKVRRNHISVAQATGFYAVHEGQFFLVTNWHVVTGLHARTGESLSTSVTIPNRIVVMHRAAKRVIDGQLISVPIWVSRSVRLLDENDKPLWLEHPKFGRLVDVVAIPVDPPADIEVHPHTIQPIQRGSLMVTDPLSIVGFPFGHTVNLYLAIWSRGYIASEPDLSYDELPCFLIDSRSRTGQSGSPVLRVARTEVDGNEMSTEVVGVYSGRTGAETDLGFVWKASAVAAVLENGTAGDGNPVPNNPAHTSRYYEQ